MRQSRPRNLDLSAPTRLHGHVVVRFDYQLFVVVQVEQHLRPELGGHAARPGHGIGMGTVHQRLDDSVIGRVHMVGQRKHANAVTVVRVETQRRLDPIVETDLFKVNVERISLTGLRRPVTVFRRLIVGRPFANVTFFYRVRSLPHYETIKMNNTNNLLYFVRFALIYKPCVIFILKKLRKIKIKF